jgi:hypothetical protein
MTRVTPAGLLAFWKERMMIMRFSTFDQPLSKITLILK